MRRRIFDILFVGSALLLVVLVVWLNCIQGTPLPGGLKCYSAATSGDLVVKILGTIVFVLFLALLGGPIAAALYHPQRTTQSNNP